MENSKQCPRCAADRLRAWDELSDEEREVVRRLPASADYSPEKRKAMHRWCNRCWYEESVGSVNLA
jgi:alpha-ketoglutarate-dependent taurine dioxygenase